MAVFQCLADSIVSRAKRVSQRILTRNSCSRIEPECRDVADKLSLARRAVLSGAYVPAMPYCVFEKTQMYDGVEEIYVQIVMYRRDQLRDRYDPPLKE